MHNETVSPSTDDSLQLISLTEAQMATEVNAPDKCYQALLLAFVALNIADAAITSVGLKTGVQEIMPIKYLFSLMSPEAALVLVKTTSIGAFLLGVKTIRTLNKVSVEQGNKDMSKWIRAPLTVLNCFYLGVVINNIYQMTH